MVSGQVKIGLGGPECAYSKSRRLQHGSNSNKAAFGHLKAAYEKNTWEHMMCLQLAQAKQV